MHGASDRDGVLVISAWVEPGDDQLRARITMTVGTQRRAVASASADDVLRIVDAWLTTMAGGGTSAPDERIGEQ